MIAARVLGYTAGDALRAVAFGTVVLATLLALPVVIALLSSLLRASIGRETLVLPFQGDDGAACVSVLVSQRVGEIARQWRAFAITQPEPSESLSPDGRLPQPGPLGGLDDDGQLNGPSVEERIAQLEETSGDQALPTLNFGGFAISLSGVISLFYRLRRALARNTIRGTYHTFGQDSRIAIQYHYAVRIHRKQTSRAEESAPRAGMAVVEGSLHTPREVVDLVDDAIFKMNKNRLDLKLEATRWSSFAWFRQAYAEHDRFLNTGWIEHRRAATRFYEHALDSEPDYLRARYNLGTLLYNQYTEPANERALRHFELAAESENSTLRALSLAGATFAIAQRAFRFGGSELEAAARADGLSRLSAATVPDLPETLLALAWARQLEGDFDGALRYYEDVLNQTRKNPNDRQFRSFALNNAGWVLLNKKGDLPAAEKYLEDALAAYKNKMAYTNLAEICVRRRDFEGALDRYDEAISLDPFYVNALNEKAMVYLTMSTEPSFLDDRQNLLDAANNWHRRALRALPPEFADDQRRQVVATFESKRVAVGVEPSELEPDAGWIDVRCSSYNSEASSK